MMSIDTRQCIHPQSADRPIAPCGRHSITPVDARVQWRTGIQRDQRSQHVLRAADLVQPVVNEREVHDRCGELQEMVEWSMVADYSVEFSKRETQICVWPGRSRARAVGWAN